jgi:hypothetical protein
LAQTKAWAESGKVADREYTDEVEEKDDEDGVDKAKKEERFAEDTNGER